MIKRVPEYFKNFKCIGSACSDNCCIGWEIDIDDDTYEFYKNVKGDFGERLKNEMYNNSFRLHNNRCAFLNDKNLCDIHAELGEEHLCVVCTEYPRFTDEFGELIETGLSLSCPSAAELILKDREKMSFITEETSGSGEDDVDSEFLIQLEKIRERIFSILQNRDISIKERIAVMLSFANAVQECINNNCPQDVEKIVEKCVIPSEKSIKNIENCIALCLDLEILEESWIDVIHRTLDIFDDNYCETCNEFEKYISDREYEYEHILIYFIFRYLLKAAFDYDVLTKVKFAVVSYIIIKQLDISLWLNNGKNFSFDDRIKNAVLYSKEVEHCQDNIDFFSEEFLFNEIFSGDNFLKMI